MICLKQPYSGYSKNPKRCAVYAFTVVALLLAGATLAAVAADGPYVLSDDGGGWFARRVAQDEAEPQVQSVAVSTGRQLTVAAVGAQPAFEVMLREPAAIVPDEIAMPAETPLFVVADTHGEYEILAELLRNQKVVDDGLRWAFGEGHLVFLGDIFDRGAHQTEILWLIYKLEAEAAKAGGAVHLLLGNHEAMVLRGDVRYLHAKYVRTAEVLGVESYSELFGPETLLGQWLRSKSAVLKLDNSLLMHGGISPELVERNLSLATINQTLRGVLDGSVDARKELPQFLMKSSGPLWYRGYFQMGEKPPAATEADVDGVLKHFGVDMILVGHTPVPTVTQLYDGKVIAVQVYPHLDEATGAAVLEGVVRRSGCWYRARIDGIQEPLLPGTHQCLDP